MGLVSGTVMKCSTGTGPDVPAEVHHHLRHDDDRRSSDRRGKHSRMLQLTIRTTELTEARECITETLLEEQTRGTPPASEKRSEFPRLARTTPDWLITPVLH